MSNNSWWQNLVTSQIDGPALTAAARATCLPGAAIFTFPANLFKIGDQLLVKASGRLSSVVTTPGTFRFDVSVGASIVADSQAMAPSTVVQTNTPWWLEILMTVRSIGNSTSATIFGEGKFSYQLAAGNSLEYVLPVTGAPAVGAGFDSTVSNAINLNFTQTVATGSLTVHQYLLAYLT